MRRVFYHGGVGDLPVGSFILPPYETGYALAVGREDRVYVTTDLVQAIACALVMKGMIYRVQPIGRLGPDDNGIAGPHYNTHRALILARVVIPATLVKFEYADFHRLYQDIIGLELALEYGVENLNEVEGVLRAA